MMNSRTEQTRKEYALIADGYESAAQRPLRAFVYYPTVRHYIGRTAGRVLDLGCGEGISSRIAQEQGATSVVGIDISEELLVKARQKAPGHDYLARDMFTDRLDDLGRFDLIIAIMALHYASNTDSLRHACTQARSALKDDGRFVAMIVTPQVFETGYHQYGVDIQKVRREGDTAEVTLGDLDGTPYCTFTNIYWKEETYRKVLEESGFESSFHGPVISDEAVRELGEAFWQDMRRNPLYTVITATPSTRDRGDRHA